MQFIENYAKLVDNRKRNENRQLLNDEKTKNLIKDYKYAELSGNESFFIIIRK